MQPLERVQDAIDVIKGQFVVWPPNSGRVGGELSAAIHSRDGRAELIKAWLVTDIPPACGPFAYSPQHRSETTLRGLDLPRGRVAVEIHGSINLGLAARRAHLR